MPQQWRIRWTEHPGPQKRWDSVLPAKRREKEALSSPTKPWGVTEWASHRPLCLPPFTGRIVVFQNDVDIQGAAGRWQEWWESLRSGAASTCDVSPRPTADSCYMACHTESRHAADREWLTSRMLSQHGHVKAEHMHAHTHTFHIHHRYTTYTHTYIYKPHTPHMPPILYKHIHTTSHISHTHTI